MPGLRSEDTLLMSVHWPACLFWDFKVATVKVEEEAAVGQKVPIQLLEYRTDVRRYRFDTLGKSTPAHRAGAPTARGRWVSPRPVGDSDILIATGGDPPTSRGHLVLPPTSG